jgi:hypothetical protein
MPRLTNASVAIAHVVPRFANMTIPMCAKAAARMKLGMRNAATAEAA